MSNLGKVVAQLGKERQESQKKVEQLDQALAALGDVSGLRKSGRGLQKSRAKRRTMSAAARKKIAAAQRARWAKWKATKNLRPGRKNAKQAQPSKWARDYQPAAQRRA